MTKVTTQMMVETAPKTIDLGYITVKLTFVPKFKKNYRVGSYHSRKHEIKARTEGILPIELANTVMHECLHIMFRLDNMERCGNEEIIVSNLANGLCELAKRNPELMEWFQKGCEA